MMGKKNEGLTRYTAASAPTRPVSSASTVLTSAVSASVRRLPILDSSRYKNPDIREEGGRQARWTNATTAPLNYPHLSAMAGTCERQPMMRA